MAKHNHMLRERLQYRENTPLYHEMPKNGYVTELVDEVQGQVTVAGGTVNGSLPGQAGGAGLIQNFELDAIQNGSGYQDGKLIKVTPRTLLNRQIFDLGYFQGDLELSNFDGRAGTFAFNCAYVHRFALPGNIQPMDTALNAYGYGTLKHTITTGGRDACFPGNDRTFDFSGLTIDVYDEREAAARGNGKVAVVLHTDQFVPVTQANTEFLINSNQLPTVGSYFDLLFICETGATFALSDAMIKKIGVSTGTEQWQNLYARRVKNAMRTGGLLKDQATDLTGLYYIPIAQDGLLGGAIDSVNLQLDVASPSGADRIILSSRRVVLPPAGK